MERLGETVEWGQVLIDLLEQAGWKVERRDSGDGIQFVATGHGTSVSATGETAVAVSVELFERVTALKFWQAAEAA